MSTAPDPFEFVKQLWGQMAIPGFGLTSGHADVGAGMAGVQMPSFDPKELEKRLAELQQVKQWLEMNLNMMGLQINALEMQLAGMAGLQAASTKAFGDHAAKNGPRSASPGDAADRFSHGASTKGAGSDAGQAPTGVPWMDPQAWMTFMQDQAAKTQQAMQESAQAMQKAAQAVQSATRPARSASAARGTTGGTAQGTARAGNAASARAAAPKRAPRTKKA